MRRYFALICLMLMLHSGRAQVAVGDSALDFSLPDTNGVHFSMQDFAGQIIVMNFFASWCQPCFIESPLLEDSIWQPFRAQGVTVIGISGGDSLWQIRDFVAQTGITYPILRDRNLDFFYAYGHRAFPSNVIINRDGYVEYLEFGFDIPFFVDFVDSLLNLTAIDDRPSNGLPQSIKLLPAYPNPFNPGTQIRYHLPAGKAGISNIRYQNGNDRLINLVVFDLLGRKVRTLVNETKMPGDYRVSWEGRNDAGQPVASGLYFYQLRAGQFTQTRRVLLVR